MPRTPGETIPSQFRFQREVLTQLDWLCENWAPGIRLTRTQVLKALIDADCKKRGGPHGPAEPPADRQETGSPAEASKRPPKGKRRLGGKPSGKTGK